jgi:hypothetical protein
MLTRTQLASSVARGYVLVIPSWEPRRVKKVSGRGDRISRIHFHDGRTLRFTEGTVYEFLTAAEAEQFFAIRFRGIAWRWFKSQ